MSKKIFELREWQLPDAASLAENANNIHVWNNVRDYFPILEDLLYEAIFQPEGAEPLPRDIIKNPEIGAYIRDFGKKQGDFCLLAELNGEIVGGAWLRICDCAI
jgi:hypothetical protein